jgi:hypothetical protein
MMMTDVQQQNRPVFDDLGPADGGGRREDHTQKPPREGKLDLRNSWQVVAGSILIPLGVVLILIGWYGAAHARVVQQQIPYMVSGSFIGLGCMVVGGFLFWGHWLYRLYDQADLHHEESQQLLELIAASLAGQRMIGGPMPADGGGDDGGGDESSYFATAAGTVYHRADCAVIRHHPDDLRVLGPDKLSGMRPCQICSASPPLTR